MKLKRLNLVFGVICFVLITSLCGASNRIRIKGKDLFLNGMNVAWDRYSNDVGDMPINENKFREIVIKVRSAGGNSIRWWLSTNGANDPKFDPSTGLVSGLGSETINNVKKVLDLCESNGLVVSLCLLSHNYLQDQFGMNVENNKKMLTTDEGLKAYIDNALIPLVTAIGNHPAIACWEIFNEPEGMVDGLGWAAHADGSGFTMKKVQVVVNRCAGAIKRVNDSLLVSNGAHTFKTSTDVGSFANYYSDSALIAVGGDPLGTLDFYQIHFYPQHQGDDLSPFHNHASHWGLDKPVVVGEFPNIGCVPIDGKFKVSSELTPVEAYNYLYDNGYAGALAWSYDGDGSLGSFEDATPAMLNLYEKHYDDIFIGELTEDTTTADHAMKINIDGLSDSNDKEWISLSYSKDLSSDSKLSLNIKIDSTYSGESIKIQFATQSDGWKWKSVNGFYSVPNDNSWHTYEISFSDMTGVTLDKMQSIILKILPTSSEPFSGVLLIDSVKTESKILSDFDDKMGLWSAGSGSETIINITAVKIEGIVEVNDYSKDNLLIQNITTFKKGENLIIAGLQKDDIVKIFFANGVCIKNSMTKITNFVNRASIKLPSTKGVYFISIKSSERNITKKIIVK